MTRVRCRLILIACVMMPVAVLASDIALVYENAESVLAGQSLIGQVALETVTVSAKPNVIISTTLYASPVGETLRHASLMRFDNELGVALLKLGEPSKDPALNAAHEKRSNALRGFLPTLPALGVLTPKADVVQSTQPFVLKINGQLAGDVPVVIAKKRETDVMLEIIRPSTVPAWNVSVEITSEPYLLFWHKSRTRDLNHVPTRTFNYDHQVMFNPLAKDRAVKISCQVHNIKQNDYVWTIKLRSKIDGVELKVPIRFEGK